ncbi:MAG TPA: lysylphosphatidylglycerol synthase transmembrane domain-containing protein [Polyangiaceae bacterium]
MSDRPPKEPLLSLRPAQGLVRKLLLSAVVALAFVWLLHSGALPVVPDARALAGVSVSHVALAAVIWLTMAVLRGARWQLLLAPVQAVPTITVIAVAMVGYAATLVFPLRSGEVVRPLLIRREGVNAWAATGTVGAERVLDGLFISSLLLLALFLDPPRTGGSTESVALGLGPDVIAGAARAAALVFSTASVALVLFYRFRELPGRMLMATLGRFRPGAAELIASRIQMVTRGIGFLARPRVAIPFLAVTALYWGLTGVGLWVLARGVGLTDLSLPGACAVLGVLAIGIIPPGAPGLFGTYQFALYAGLALYFSKARLESQGALLVFSMYVIQVLVILLCGAVGLAYVLRTSSRAGVAKNLSDSPAPR